MGSGRHAGTISVAGSLPRVGFSGSQDHKNDMLKRIAVCFRVRLALNFNRNRSILDQKPPLQNICTLRGYFGRIPKDLRILTYQYAYVLYY
jgi:hypothetical protein